MHEFLISPNVEIVFISFLIIPVYIHIKINNSIIKINKARGKFNTPTAAPFAPTGTTIGQPVCKQHGSRGKLDFLFCGKILLSYHKSFVT
jgi:hypothetical protein